MPNLIGMQRSRNNTAKRDYTERSGNVLADLGHPQADEKLVKAELAQRIAETFGERNLTQAQAALAPGIDQPKISALIRGRLFAFSIERLLRFLLMLGNDVAISIKPRHHARTKARVRTTSRKLNTTSLGRLTVDKFIAIKTSKRSREKKI